MKLSVFVLLALTVFGPCSVFGELKMVAFIFRHGARTPVSPYPNDIHANFTWDGLSRGALTSAGIKQMYEHGSRLGDTYKSLLAKEGMFRNYNLQAKSSKVERSIMSGLSFLAGFFPPNRDANPLSVNWQPVPIYPIPPEQDYYIYGMACKKVVLEYMKTIYYPADDFIELITRDREMISVFEEITGIKNMDLMDIYNIFDVMKIQAEWNLAPPPWFKKRYWSRFEDYTQMLINSSGKSPEMVILRGGPLITEILDSMDAAVANSNHKKVFIYSGHDVTVSDVARALNIESQVSRVFEYGATLALELHGTGNVNEIRIKFYSSADCPHPISINIPNCPQPCPLQNFKDLYDHLIIRNITEICKH